MSASMNEKNLSVSAAIAGFSRAVDSNAAQTTAIMNGQVQTITGGVIENGDVIIRDGRIAQVGANLTAPCRRHNYRCIRQGRYAGDFCADLKYWVSGNQP